MQVDESQVYVHAPLSCFGHELDHPWILFAKLTEIDTHVQSYPSILPLLAPNKLEPRHRTTTTIINTI